MGAVLQAAAVVNARGINDSPAAGLSLVMDALAYGVLLLTTNGQLLHANLAARHELARRRVLTLQEGHVHAADAAQARPIAQALAKAGAGRRSLVALRSKGIRLSVALVPLRHEPGGHGAQVAMILSRASLCDAVMLCFFARAHGLTPSEEQVLAILCQGYSAPDIAVQLKVAVSTVRSHIRSLCAKTHSRGVRALLGQVAVLPPIAAAHLQDPLH